MDRIKELKERRLALAEKSVDKWIKAEKEAYQPNDERSRNFEQRESVRQTRPSIPSDLIIRERIIGATNDIKDFPPFELARKRGRPVARLHELVPGMKPTGFGTGFLIAPNLLITNHHVFPDMLYAQNCAANFLNERMNGLRIDPGITFALKPEIFFYKNEEFDFAIVYVEEKSIDSPMALKDLDLLPLIATKGKIIPNRPLSIIQYPMGGYKKYAFENNLVTSISEATGDIFYTTDTLPASSGSPGFNDGWEVAALHYTGVPMIKNGKWQTKDSKDWDRSMPEDQILWVANAGKSISKIVALLRTLSLESNQQSYINKVLEYSVDPLVSSGNINERFVMETERTDMNNIIIDPGHNLPLKTNDMSNITMNFNGQTTVTVNQVMQASQPVISPSIATESLLEKSIRFDENYDSRAGYLEDFLDGFIVPAPWVSQRRNELYKPFQSNEPLVFRYHNYSLVVNKKRRFLMWSAANVDYSEKVRDGRDRKEFGNDSKAWRLDPRIPAKYQVQAEEFYDPATLIDKGHMVRRDDNVWAANKNSLQIEYANADTFHWLNCTPQHELFNRDMFGVKGLWGILENYIKKLLNDPKNKNKDYNQKACVLSGPVLDNENDPEYNDIQYPTQFWKVFVINSESAGPLVYGFVLSQADVIEKFGLEKEGRPRFDAIVNSLRRDLKSIEELSGVSFHESLHEYDQGVPTQ